MNRATLREARDNANVAAFLRVIRQGESSQDDDAFTVCYGGTHFAAPPWDHPRKPITAGAWTSTAAGAFQFLARTWDGLVRQYGFEDFSPDCQTEGAIALIAGRKALDDVIAGRFDQAIAKCGKEWASLPGSPYGQPTMTLPEARDIYARWGGSVLETATIVLKDATPAKESTMPAPLLIPIITALLPTITSLIPALASVFKPGSEVAQRNVAGLTVVANAITQATQEPNIQAAIERMQNDPEALAAATAAVTAPEIWNQLVEVGPGVEAARKQAASSDQIEWWKNPAVIVAILVLPLVYMVVSAVVFGVGGQAWSDDVKTLTVTAILSGALGSITGFFLGSSLGSQRKTTMLGGQS